MAPYAPADTGIRGIRTGYRAQRGSGHTAIYSRPRRAGIRGIRT
jgi:hypothetical protein